VCERLGSGETEKIVVANEVVQWYDRWYRYIFLDDVDGGDDDSDDDSDDDNSDDDDDDDMESGFKSPRGIHTGSNVILHFKFSADPISHTADPTTFFQPERSCCFIYPHTGHFPSMA
jgi:hypothetical protein